MKGTKQWRMLCVGVLGFLSLPFIGGQWAVHANGAGSASERSEVAGISQQAVAMDSAGIGGSAMPAGHAATAGGHQELGEGAAGIAREDRPMNRTKLEDLVTETPGAHVVDPQEWVLPDNKMVRLPKDMAVFDPLRIQRKHKAVFLNVNDPAFLAKLNEDIKKAVQDTMRQANKEQGPMAFSTIDNYKEVLTHLDQASETAPFIRSMHAYQLQAMDDQGYHTAYVVAVGVGKPLADLIGAPGRLKDTLTMPLHIEIHPYDKETFIKDTDATLRQPAYRSPEVLRKVTQETLDKAMKAYQKAWMEQMHAKIRSLGEEVPPYVIAEMNQTERLWRNIRFRLLDMRMDKVDTRFGIGYLQQNNDVTYYDNYALTFGYMQLFVPQEDGLLVLLVMTNGADYPYWTERIPSLLDIKKVGV